ncbi:MAG: ATP-dependent DNA helicase RecQ, partial [Chitinophagales bacterium]|nr:ATP-dependent DNA helicase RecQ [Chitinophagales bacterium]
DQLHKVLQEYFGFDSFKGDQEAIIQNLLAGNDTFVLMPTGGGKSLCYQLPAILSEGTAIIISPLIALMKNQVDLVRSYSNDESIAHFYNSTLTVVQKRQVEADVRAGKTKMLYVAPETLAKDDNLAFYSSFKVSFIGIDEAHCISEWGHDFRPEYRKIKETLDTIDTKIPMMALTATATPKVQHDIVKNLGLRNHKLFISSFNRPNLYYEIRHKPNDEWAIKSMVQYIRQHEGKSGIIYVLNRKSAEQIAEILCVNGIKAAPYHAGLDSKVRNNTQDNFLKEEIDVIVATVAFGMGIDKPDIRFVIHFNIAKSLENYYQETGRAGRDGLEGNCIAYFNYKDINKVEKLLSDKTVVERERAMLLIDETVAYIENAGCRRKFLLHYFGEDFQDDSCSETKMCDNCRNPKEKKEVSEDIQTVIEAVIAVAQSHNIDHLVKVIRGVKSDAVVTYKHHELEIFGIGKEQEAIYWNSVVRKTILENLIYREIEEYGTLKLTEKGKAYLDKPFELYITLNHDYESEGDVTMNSGNSAVVDPILLAILKDLRKKEAKKLNLPPYIIFQDPSLEEMCFKYPISVNEFSEISGVSKGKAEKYGATFSDAIKQYVIENNIERPTDISVKSVVNKSGDKVKIIRAIDKKIPLENVAKELNMPFEDLVEELETIVNSGTKLDIKYYLEDILDPELLEEMLDFFKDNENGDIKECYDAFVDDDIPHEDIQLVRLQFMSDMAN